MWNPFKKSEEEKENIGKKLADIRWNKEKEVKSDQRDSDFIDKMMKFEQFRNQVYVTEQNKRQSIINEVLENLEEEGDGGTDDKMLMNLVMQFLSKGNPTSAIPGQAISEPSTAAQGILSDQQAAEIAKNITEKMPGKFRPWLDQLGKLSDADVLKIKRHLEVKPDGTEANNKA